MPWCGVHSQSVRPSINLLKNGYRDPKLAQMLLMGSQPSVVALYVDPKSNMATSIIMKALHFIWIILKGQYFYIPYMVLIKCYYLL